MVMILSNMDSGVVSEAPSASLFTLDTAGSQDVRAQLKRTRKPLKVDEILARRSAVPAVSLRKRPGESLSSTGEEKRQRTSYVSHKELVRLRRIADGKQESTQIEAVDATYDPWNDSELVVAEAKRAETYSFLDGEKKKTAPRSIRQKPISLAASGKNVAAVGKPAGGFSYNPIYTDYEDRLVHEGEKEVEAENKRQSALEAEQLAAEAHERSRREAEAAEARADLSEWDEDSAWEGIESGEESTKHKKRPERKTQAQRNKIARRKDEERRALMARNDKKKHDQALLVKQLAAEVAAKDAQAQALALATRLDAADTDTVTDSPDLELRRRKLGKIALPERDLELVLPDELADSLRLLKPEGNLLKERYRSVLVRGLVESRRPISFKKQRRVTMTEKWAHKDFMLH